MPAGARVANTPGGGSVTRVGGRVADVRTPGGVEVHNGLNGRATVVREMPNNTRVVAHPGGFGYVQRPFVVHGNTYAARTYYVGGRPYESFYRPYAFHGVAMEVYAPARFYPVGFYAYVGTPWGAPMPYRWGWGVSTPWFGFYGGYFAPYPVYAGPAFWLTDYLISQSLAAEYQAQMAAQAQPGGYPPQPAPGQAYGGPVALTPDVKQAIADEVRRQMSLEQAEAQTNALNNDPNPMSSGIARMFSDNSPHVFVVGDDLDLVDAGGRACAVSQGDVLQLTQPPPQDAPAATLVVMASKGGVECSKGTAVQVGLADLQNMQNHMRETLDQGLADLQAHQGGLPSPPQQALAMATPAVFMTDAPPPDQTVATQINQQYQQGTLAAQDVIGLAPAPDSAPSPAPAAQPNTISLGQTIDQVVAMLGQPKSIVDLGAKKIYVYPSIKITFSNGAVADVE